ncbi:MAG: T9SS type A sorting domain-containing protein, partial [Bacteroidota bacterium]
SRRSAVLSATGAYTITAAVSVNGDGNSFNDTIVGTTENLPLVDTYPYFEDFESGAGGWSATGTLPSWAFGTPAKAVISGAGSGANAWVTGGLGQGTYNANEASAVEGPCFDFTTLPAGAAVGLKVWWEAESSFDGAALQVSTDGGTSWSTIGAFNDPINWYNDTLINSAPGGSIEGWTGSSASGDGSGGYVQAQHPLDPALAGQADVRFRVAFGSDGSTEYDGFAFDDIAIGVPPAIDLGSDSIITCGGDILNPGAGFASYLWSNGATTQTVSLINLTGQPIVDSVITVIVTDNAGLIATDTVVVTISGEAPEVSASVNNDVSCFGEDDGIAFAQGTGGTGNLTYEWNTNPPQNTQVATGLTAGTYVITVSDQGGCVVTDSVTIVEPAELTVEINAQVNVDCAGDTDGSLDVNIVGGEAPYSIEWNTGDTTTVLTGLGAGTYDATITDAGGCENTVSVDIIAENEAPVASFSASSAGTTVTFTNTSVGTGAYAWDFGDGAGVSSDESPVYTYASTGAYSVLLIVSNACGTSSTRDSVFVGVMSRQDLLNSELSLYPNPTTGLVELQVAGMNLNEVEVHLFTLQGQEVHVESIGYLPAGATHRLTLSDALSEGMYLLQLRSREGLLHKRLTLKR